MYHHVPNGNSIALARIDEKACMDLYRMSWYGFQIARKDAERFFEEITFLLNSISFSFSFSFESMMFLFSCGLIHFSWKGLSAMLR
jgi:hypothetical protein